MIIFFLLMLQASCSGVGPRIVNKDDKKVYSYVDPSGRYFFVREQKVVKNKLITRAQLSSNQGSLIKPLEKSIVVSEIGSVKEKNSRTRTVRPFASEFTVWLEGKRYHSKMKLNVKNKSMDIELDSPETKWKGRSTVVFPKGTQFCFYSQISECLYQNGYLNRSLIKKGVPFHFTLLWDNFPFLQEQLSGVGATLFSPASLKYEGEEKGILKFQVEVNGQAIFFQFSKSMDLVRMFWIAQGISIVPPGEETSDDLDE